MKRSFLIALMLVFVLMLACGPAAPEPVPEPIPIPSPEPTLTPVPEPAPSPEVPPGFAHLTPNPVEESMPIYGGILRTVTVTPRSFDGHQQVGKGPPSQLPAFNQLVHFDLNYFECVPETIIGDLAESWETSQDGTEITFKLHQGVKWHDGMPFTAEDVVYSMDKMTDVTRSAIADLFPAYESTEKLDDYTVTIHLKYASAGFMLALAGPHSQIQAKHLAGTDDQSIDFVIGTGPFIMTDYLTRVESKWKRNPDYFKKDKYGNQLPYLDGLHLIRSGGAYIDMFIGRRTDVCMIVGAAASKGTWDKLVEGAPEALWQRKHLTDGVAIYLNLKHKPLDDIRVRRAMALVLEEENLIIGYSSDPIFGIVDVGLLHPSFGLPKEEVLKLMGWDKPWSERVAEAQKLMSEAGYPDGFKLNMLSGKAAGAQTVSEVGTNLVFADALRRHLKIESEVHGLAGTEKAKRLDEGNYDLYTASLLVGENPSQLQTYFQTDGYANHSNYANPEMDKMLDNLDRIIDPEKRQEAIWAIERTLLTDLAALPTGNFRTRHLFYYPHMKNLRWQSQVYDANERCEDIWIDESLRAK